MFNGLGMTKTMGGSSSHTRDDDDRVRPTTSVLNRKTHGRERGRRQGGQTEVFIESPPYADAPIEYDDIQHDAAHFPADNLTGDYIHQAAHA